jgi:ADP-heptose:LPS heptosyltransferase
LSASISLDDAAAARAWFTEVVEPLADSFDANDVERYVSVFSEVLQSADPSYRAADLVIRYERIRRPEPFTAPDPEHVFVLSRVTLGADIAITSVVLDAAKKRFPAARIWYVGSKKGHELFAADSRIEHAPAPYDRTGSLRDRILASQSLENLVNRARSVVIDPDSRLTQLGLVPVCPAQQYFFFETRTAPGPGSLSELTARWLEYIFGVKDAKPYIAVPPAPGAGIAVSLGTGENPAKCVPHPFERLLLERLAATGRSILVDQGTGGEEAQRVQAATAGLPNVELFEGRFAPFAARVASSELFVGYDSAAQHAAAACGVPVIAIFAGFPNPRFLERWRPTGPGPVTIIEAAGQDPAALLERIATLL